MKKNRSELEKNLPPGWVINRYGVPVKKLDTSSPVPMAARVGFKRPLSAHERVMRAIKQYDAYKRREEEPGDDTFDSPAYDELTPHQLITDPDTGEEMTAGEHIMLQKERSDAKKQVREYVAEKTRRESRKRIAPKKAAKAADVEDEKAEEIEAD